MPVYKRIYGRKHKRDRIVWCYKFEVAGKRYSGTAFSSRKEAADAEAKRRRDLNSKAMRPLVKESITFDQFTDKFIEHRQLIRAPGTVSRERRRTRPLIGFFNNRHLQDISTGEVQNYRDARIRAGLMNRSVNLELSLLRSILRYAMEQGYIDHNPAHVVKNLCEVKDEHRIPTTEELKAFVDAASETSSGPVLVPWIWFMAYTGARPGESFLTQWTADINFDREQIRVFNSKSNGQTNQKYRFVEMHPKLKPILLEWRDEWQRIFRKRAKRYPNEASPPHDWVFFNPKNQDERARSFFKCFYQARDKVGLPKMTRHTLRHFFISHCVMSGIDFFTIAKWVNHKNTKMIQEVYGHLSPKYRRKEMAKLTIDHEDDCRDGGMS